MMKFRFITPQDPEYPQELMLRWEVLAKPLGLPPGMEEKNEETKSLHLIALDRKKLVGCVLFCPEGEKQGSVREMALSEEYQGRGFGRKLMAMLEHALQERGIEEIKLLSPPERTGFYERMGYKHAGELVKKSGILWQPMRKTL
ncbi:MAG: GNAT family N-acetyltransferase [Chlamydiales bacterium]